MINRFVLALMILVSSMAVRADVPEFEALDANSDGFISVAEATVSADVMNAFNGADADEDGLLSPDEYATIES